MDVHSIALAVNIYSLVWFQHPFSFNIKSEIRAFNAVYPLNLIQNVLTTGLIIVKIWMQYRRSSAMRVIDRSSRLNLIKIIRIVIESAMIYTIQLLVLITLYFRGDNFENIMGFAIVPSTGEYYFLRFTFLVINFECRHCFRSYHATCSP